MKVQNWKVLGALILGGCNSFLMIVWVYRFWPGSPKYMFRTGKNENMHSPLFPFRNCCYRIPGTIFCSRKKSAKAGFLAWWKTIDYCVCFTCCSWDYIYQFWLCMATNYFVSCYLLLYWCWLLSSIMQAKKSWKIHSAWDDMELRLMCTYAWVSLCKMR